MDHRAGDERDLVEAYRRDGFVAAPGLLDVAEVEHFKSVVDAAVARRTRADTRSFYEKTAYGQSFLQCLMLWEDTPGVRPLNFHPKIAGLAAQLLGCERLRLWHDQALYKEPGGRETEAHQDFGYWPVNEPDMLTAWIPLIDVDEENGCMGYVPGTQATDRAFVNIFTAPGEGKAYGDRFGQPVFVPAKRGDVIFHAAKTVHMAGANSSSSVRAAHTVVYFRDGCTRAASGNDIAIDRNGNHVGDVIAGPATPIAWPLPDGRLPDPPPPPERPTKEYRQMARVGSVPMPRDG